MKCLILAAGYATRLYPLTKNFPKPLLKVGDRTIIDRLIDDLFENVGVREFVVVSNNKMIGHFEKWKVEKVGDLNISLIDDGSCTNETRLGAVKDIQLAVDTLDLNEELLVMAGDNVLDFSLAGFVDFAKKTGTSCVMCHEENDLKKQQKTAIIKVNTEGLVTSFEEKPKEPKGNLAVPPFYYYRAEDIRKIPEALTDGCGYDAPGSFTAWLSRNTEVHAYTMPGKRYDVGDLESYRRLKALYAVED